MQQSSPEQVRSPEQQLPAARQTSPEQPFPAQPTPQQPGAPEQQSPSAPGSPQVPAPSATPPGAVVAPGSSAPAPGEAPSPLALALDASAAAPVQTILSQLAASKAPPGAKPFGAVMVANFQQGQQLEAQVQMVPGRCYTLVGAGLPPSVTEVDLKLVAITPTAGMDPLLAADRTTGTQAVIGERPNCFKWDSPDPAPVLVVVSVTGGSGLAAAQLFAK